MKKILVFALISLLTIVIAACGSVEDTTPPVLQGVEDATIFLGEEFDPMEGVTAIDNKDGDITDQVVVQGTFNVDAVGSYFLRYIIEDAAGNRTERSRYLNVVVDPSLVGDEMVANGDFSLGTAFWSWTTGLEGGNATFTVVEGELEIDITSVSDGMWEPRLENKDITFEQGQAYQITFEARAVAPRSVHVQVGEILPSAPWFLNFKPGQTEIFDLTTEMQEFSFVFVMGLETNENGALLFEFGTVGPENYLTTVYLDNVAIIPVDEFEDTIPPEISGAGDTTIILGSTFDPLAGVSVMDNVDGAITITLDNVTGEVDTSIEGVYELTYTVSDEAGNERVVVRTITVVNMIFNDTDIIENGDFTEPLDAENPVWQLYQANWGEGSPYTEGSLTIVNDELVLEVIDIGSWGYQGWMLQAMQVVELEVGYTYKVVFEVKAAAAREITAVVGHYNSATDTWVQYGGGTFAITDEYVVYEYMFTLDKVNDGFPIELKFEFGQAAETVYVNSVDVLVWEQGPLQENGTFDETGWNYWSQSWDEGDGIPVVDVEIINDELVVTYDGLGNANWAIQVFQNGLPFIVGETYLLSFDAKADHVRSFNTKIIVLPGGAEEMLLGTPELTTEMQRFEFEFVYNGSEDIANLNFELGVLPNAEAQGVITFDNISIVRLDAEKDVIAASEIVINGTFDQVIGWSYWSQDWDEGDGIPVVTVEGIDGQLVLTYDGLGNQNWAIQVFQNDIPMIDGATYTLEFEMKADHAREINAKLIPASGPVEFVNTITLSTEMTRYVFTFTYDVSVPTANINFEFGLLPDAALQGIITLDNVLLYRNFNE